MDLGSPGADLLGPIEAAALRVLARQTRGLSGRDIARLAGTNPSSTRRALLRLTHIGLVDSAPASHAHLYRLQRDHVLWEPLRQILTTPAVVQDVLGRWLATRLDQQATLAMFGSVARGDADGDSDLDLVLVFADDVDTGERDAVTDELRTLTETLTGNPAQILSIDRAALVGMVAAADPLVASWQREAINLSGPHLLSLLDTGTHTETGTVYS